tara:strand:- start:63 stop:440 length:378 start_codon:yes stop_codon:yes gene_type:complete
MRLVIALLLVSIISSCSLAKINHNSKMVKSESISNVFKDEKAVQTKVLFNNVDQKVIVLKIQENEVLKEHVSKVAALLVCINGEAIYKEKDGRTISMKNGDFVEIPKEVLHEVVATKESEFLLIK